MELPGFGDHLIESDGITIRLIDWGGDPGSDII